MIKRLEEVGYYILERLNVLIKLTALSLLKGMEFKEQVKLLNSIGLKPKEIAEILGKSAVNVRVALHHIRKQKSESQKVHQYKEENGRE